jgi:hypothetical protein
MSKTRRVLLVSAGGAVALLLAEVFVRLFVPVRTVGPVFSEYHPRYGATLKRSFAARRITPEFSMSLSTNSRGFRGPELGGEVSRPILCIGDSFTMGYGVSDGEEFPALLRGLLAEACGPGAIPVVNAGIGAVGNGIWVRFLPHEAPGLDPRLVILQLCGNDIGNNLREGLYDLSAQGTLIENPTPPPSRERRILRVIEKVPGLSYSHVFGLVKQYWYLNSIKKRSVPKAGFGRRRVELSLAIWTEIVRICEQHHWPLLVLTVDFKPAHEERVRRFFHDRDAPVVTAPSKDERPDLYYRIDGHWNREGHRFISRQVLDAVEIAYPGLVAECAD